MAERMAKPFDKSPPLMSDDGISNRLRVASRRFVGAKRSIVTVSLGLFEPVLYYPSLSSGSRFVPQLPAISSQPDQSASAVSADRAGVTNYGLGSSHEVRGRFKGQSDLRNQSESVLEHDGIYRAHKARILGLCRLLLRDPDEAQDVAHEVFVRAFERLRKEEPPTIWEAWLVRVAINACRDRQRSGWWKSRRKNVELDETSAGSVPSSEADALARERRTRIWHELQRLGTKQRNVFVLRYVEGWSTSEVAEALGLNPGSVKAHLFRAVRKLRKAMEF